MSDYQTAVAYFPSQASAEAAITDLKTAGFLPSQIGVAAATSPAGNSSTAYNAGKTAGSAWEKVKGFFSTDSAEPYAGERSGTTFNDNVIAPDPAYDSQDLHGSLSQLSVPDEHSRYFGHRLGRGEEGAVVTVNAPGREAEARNIMEEAGGDIGDDAASYDYAADPATATGTQNIQLFGEVLRVHKDRVNSGEVRIRKEVTTTTQTVEVPVTREELVVERVPVSGHVAGTGNAFQGEEIRIPLSEERASVTKDVIVREQVKVGKKEVTNVESHIEQVRSEDLKVDQDVRDKTGTY